MTLFTWVTTTKRGTYASITKRVPQQYRPQVSGCTGCVCRNVMQTIGGRSVLTHGIKPGQDQQIAQAGVCGFESESECEHAEHNQLVV